MQLERVRDESGDAVAPARTLAVATDVGLGASVPYVAKFYEALRPHGIELDPAPLRWTDDWIDRNRGRLDFVHLQWPEWSWQPTTKGLRRRLPWIHRAPGLERLASEVGTAWLARRFLRWLEAVKKAGIKIVRTVHNLDPHESEGRADRAAHREVYRLADLVICHDRNALERCETELGTAGRTIRMPHGNFDGVYPSPRPREVVLTELGLDPALPTVACIGGIRDYKGFDVACRACGLLDGDVQLIVAGQSHPKFDIGRFTELVNSTPRSKLVHRRLDDQEFADFVSAADLSMVPYRKITTSGFLPAALTLSRAVVGSDLPFLREVVGSDPSAARLVAPGDPAALAKAVQAMLEVSADERNAAARAVADRYAWSDVVIPAVEALRRLTR